MQFYWLVLGVLGVWRITHFLNAEDGPMDIGVHLRKIAGTSMLGRLLDCFYCLSVWVAGPAAFWIGQGTKERCFLWPAVSAGAILIERLTAPDRPIPPALYFEGEEKDELLRKTTKNLAR